MNAAERPPNAAACGPALPPPRLTLVPARRPAVTTLSMVIALAVSACGGGGGGGPVVGPTGSSGAATGVVTGLGSVIVNGVRFDDGTALIRDDSGATRTRSDLKLGMVVDVTSGPISPGSGDTLGAATATRVQYGSSIKGPVTARNLVAGTLTVLGQTITVPAGVAFDGYPSGLGGVAINDLIEVHALFDPTTQTFRGTRIEKAASLAECKVVGVAQSVDRTARSFVIRSLGLSYTAGATLNGLNNATTVKVRMPYTPGLGCGTSAVTEVSALTSSPAEGAQAELDGFITDYIGNTSFKVNGLPVRAGTAITGLGNGVRVEVEGTVQSGVLVASRVELRSGAVSDDRIRLYGVPSSVNPTDQTLLLRGVTVSYATANLENGITVGNLGGGTALEVRGDLDATGTQVVATRIRPAN